jgi:ElaB/YqjD/DUF883 family membrane-anchored ribosome-binding protein
MDDEAALIRNQMLQTRTSLTEKIEAIEEKLTNVVSETADTVTQTASAVTETVEKVKEAVEGTVNTISGTAEEAVESVKEAFDIRRQVADHPWLLLGGAVAAGFASGLLLDRMTSSASSGWRGTGLGYAPTSYAEETQRRSSGPGWFGELETSLAPVLSRLKGLAIGTTLGLVGQMILPSVPEALRGQLSEVVDQLTTSLGGERVQGLTADQRHG